MHTALFVGTMSDRMAWAEFLKYAGPEIAHNQVS